MGFGWETAFTHYGEVWKGLSLFALILPSISAVIFLAHRKIFYQELGGSNAAIYNHQQVDSARFQLRRLLDDPEVFMDSIRLCVASFIPYLRHPILISEWLDG